jgi:hypothetical protein
MIVLTGWAAGNISAGIYAYSNNDGQGKYFHQMNVMWNSVNLGIGILGYLGLSRQESDLYSLRKTFIESMNFEKVLLFNAGLDVGYMAIGGLLWERGLRKMNDRFLGYGKSMLLQGGFLFVFDLILYHLNRKHNGKLLEILSNVTFSVNQARINVKF